MKHRIYLCLLLLLYSTISLAGKPALQLLVIPKSNELTLDSCHIKKVSIINSDNKQYLSLELTVTGMNKAYELLRLHKGNGLVITFGSDVILRAANINFPQPPRAILAEITSKDAWSKKVVNTITKAISQCSETAI